MEEAGSQLQKTAGLGSVWTEMIRLGQQGFGDLTARSPCDWHHEKTWER